MSKTSKFPRNLFRLSRRAVYVQFDMTTTHPIFWIQELILSSSEGSVLENFFKVMMGFLCIFLFIFSRTSYSMRQYCSFNSVVVFVYICVLFVYFKYLFSCSKLVCESGMRANDCFLILLYLIYSIIFS